MLGHSTDQTFAGRHDQAWYAALAARVPAAWMVLSGIVMFVLYIAMDVIASLRYDGYSYTDQAISELSAIGAPTRAFWSSFSVAYQLLSFVFAFGVLALAGQRRTVRAIGWLLLVWAVVNLLWWLGPMHQREALAAGEGDWRDTLHLVVGGMNSVLFFAMIGVGMFAFGKRFRWYSLATIAAMVVFGTLMNLQAPDVQDDQPTPWLGIYERVAVEGAMLWLAAFAAVLIWHARPKSSRPGG